MKLAGKLGPLRVVLEQLGRLKTPQDGLDAIAAAIRGDRVARGLPEDE